jgi:hypothetical protein
MVFGIRGHSIMKACARTWCHDFKIPYKKLRFIKRFISELLKKCRSKVELVLSYGSQFSEIIFIFSGSEF